MSDLFAFQLRSDLDLDELQGATIAYGPLAHMFDIKGALEAGNGTIVTDDSILIGTLRGHEFLEEGQVPSGDVTLATLPEGSQVEAAGSAPVSYTPQTGLADPNVAAQHAPEAETVEEALVQGAGEQDSVVSEEETVGEEETGTDPDESARSW